MVKSKNEIREITKNNYQRKGVIKKRQFKKKNRKQRKILMGGSEENEEVVINLKNVEYSEIMALNKVTLNTNGILKLITKPIIPTL